MFGRKNLTKYYIAQNKIYESLIDAMDLKNTDKIAFVGGGGKTTTIKRLAQDFNDRGSGCVVMTTTNMYYEPLVYGMEKIIQKLRFGETVFVGEKLEKNGILKIASPKKEVLNFLMSLDEYPVLIEADGSKGRPIKIQRSHEPVVPENIKKVVLVVGIDALYGEISDVFARPEDYKGRSNVLTVKEMAKIVVEKNGMFKDIDDKEVTILINKVDDENKLQNAFELMDEIKFFKKVEVVISNQKISSSI